LAQAEGLRAVKGTVEDDADHGIEGVGRKSFRAGDEVAGGVVNQRIDVAELQFGFGRGSFDGGVIADITSGVGGRAA
jgi:hypothetical protein